MKKLHFCIHGAGGLGSLIGGFLARDGHRVTLIGRGAHVDAINKNGLNVDGVRAKFNVKEISAVTTPDQVEGDIDFYILLTKGKGTKQALADAACLVERTSAALSLQNGVNKEKYMVDCFGEKKVIGGSIMEGANMRGPADILNHMSVPITAYFGELKGGQTDRTRAIAEALDHSGLGARSVDDIQHVLWEKVIQVGSASVWSASSLAAIPRLDFADGLGVRESAEHLVQISKEMLAIYKALGYTPQNFYAPVSRLKEIDADNFEDAVDAYMVLGKRFLDGSRPLRTSMHDDIVAGRKMEVDEVLGPIVDAGRRLNVPMPTFLAAYRVLKTLNVYL